MSIQVFPYYAKFVENVELPAATEDKQAPNFGQVKNYVLQEISNIPGGGNKFKHHDNVMTGYNVAVADCERTLVSSKNNLPANATIENALLNGAILEIQGSLIPGTSTYTMAVIIADGTRQGAFEVNSNEVAKFLWSEDAIAWLYIGRYNL